MKKQSWIMRQFELEDQGRFEEAEQHLIANTTPEQRRNFAKLAEGFAAAMAKIPPESWAEGEEIMKRFRALKHLPDDNPKRMIWENFWGETPASMCRLNWRRNLPDPLAFPGRPIGSVAVGEDVFLEMNRRVAAGEKPTRAAKAIVGDIAGAKNRADYIVRKWRERGNN